MNASRRGAFKEQVVAELIKSQFVEEKTRLSSDAVRAVAVLADLIVREALGRAMILAERESAAEVTEEHLERVIPQIMLDFL